MMMFDPCMPAVYSPMKLVRYRVRLRLRGSQKCSYLIGSSILIKGVDIYREK